MAAAKGFNEAGALEPRKTRRNHADPDQPLRFNEAGALEPRKTPTLLGLVITLKSFNEAGALEPRKTRAGVKGPVEEVLLQ